MIPQGSKAGSACAAKATLRACSKTRPRVLKSGLVAFLSAAALLLGATSANAAGSGSWTGDAGSDFYDPANWTGLGAPGPDDPAGLPNGNVTFVDSALTGVGSTIIDRSSGGYNYLYGFIFSNTLDTENSYTFTGANINWGGGESSNGGGCLWQSD